MIHPRVMFRWSMGVLAASGALAVVALLCWGFRMDLVDDRPQLYLMAYMLLLLIAVASGAVACIASFSLATHKAFVSGYRTAMYQAGFDVMDQEDDHGHHVARVVPLRPDGTNGTT